MDINRLQLPRLISDGMVLQRNMNVNIWGWSIPGDRIVLKFLNRTWSTVSDELGRWKIRLNALEAGGPYEMEIASDNGEKYTIKDILVGDVWLTSGQSNMELPMERVKDQYPEDILGCQNERIRIFKVPECYDFHGAKEDFPEGGWKAATTKNILEFSALSYYFEKYMYETNSIPIGVINVSLGGSPIESWMSEEMLEEFLEYKDIVNKYKDDEFIKKVLAYNEESSNEWYCNIDQTDLGLMDRGNPWYGLDIDDRNWEEFKLPGFFEDSEITDFIGVIWFRKEIMIPEMMLGKEVNLWLGTIVDSDTVYVNGIKVGATDYQYPPRKYKIPPHLLKDGENVITVRVICNDGKGRFTPGKKYSLFTKDNHISLEGSWKYKIGGRCERKPDTNFISWKPTGLYNGMLAPCHNYTIQGILWYQGESNTHKPDNYYALFSKLITSWREKWKQGDLPFIYAQLPNFEIDLTKESGWPELREEQLKGLKLPNTAMIVTIDLGEDNDLHPLNKKDIGYRMSLAARSLVFHEPIEYSGPILKSAMILDKKAILTFSHGAAGIITKNGGNPDCFQVAGADRKYMEANAVIDGEQIIVWSEKTEEPRYIKYAFMNGPKGELIYNKAGLPASPFRIDILMMNEEVNG